MFFEEKNNNSSLIIIMISALSVIFFYRYRYRLMNTVLGNRAIRRYIVSLTMQIPFVRERLLTKLMPF